MRENPSVHYLWADTLRIFATFSVIVVHLASLNNGLNSKSVLSVILFSIVKTCVPLFILLSGALLMTKSDELKTFFKKRLGRIGLPWMFWTAVYTIIFLWKGENVGDFFNIGHSYIVLFFTLIWFMPIIAGLYLFTPLFRYLFYTLPKYFVFIYLIIWLGIITFLPFLHKESSLLRTNHPVIFLQIFLYSGYFLIGGVLQHFTISPRKSYMIGGVSILLGFTWTRLLVDSGYGPDSYDYLGTNIALLSIGVFFNLEKILLSFY